MCRGHSCSAICWLPFLDIEKVYFTGKARSIVAQHERREYRRLPSPFLYYWCISKPPDKKAVIGARGLAAEEKQYLKPSRIFQDQTRKQGLMQNEVQSQARYKRLLGCMISFLCGAILNTLIGTWLLCKFFTLLPKHHLSGLLLLGSYTNRGRSMISAHLADGF